MKSPSNEQVYAALGTSRQSLSQYLRRRADYQDGVYSAEAMLLTHRADHGGLGLEKAYYMIQPEGLGRDAFIREMTLLGHSLERKRSYIRTTKSGGLRYPNLVKLLTIIGLNRVWQSDTTYYRLEDKYYYLTFIIDVYSRLIVGYSVSDNLRARANIEALKMAFRLRRGMDLSELIFHSDGGSQYRSNDFIEVLRSRGISSSMCITALDNAYAEKLNDVIKNEYLEHWPIRDYRALRRYVKRAVENYNKVRHHSQLPLRIAPLGFECYLEESKGQRPPSLLIRDGEAKELEYQPMAAQNLTYPSSGAFDGTSQILPAFVKLGLPKEDGQLALSF
ncbi:transposase [Lewinella sp. LCG006]|uniref:transposase n=1 Tax=Lewinella sp. LCG006 TaxID=3231911 RepID=UPI00345F5A52